MVSSRLRAKGSCPLNVLMEHCRKARWAGQLASPSSRNATVGGAGGSATRLCLSSGGENRVLLVDLNGNFSLHDGDVT